MTESRHRCHDCLVRDKALCASLSDNELEALSAMARRKTYAHGDVVIWAGEDNLFCANIVSGALKLTVSTADGRQQIVGLLFPGDFVGQIFKTKASMTVAAVVETELCIFPRIGFERALDTYPQMERLLLKRTMASLGIVQKRMLSVGKKKALERVAGFLLELTKRTGVPNAQGGIDVVVPVSRGELADFLGLTIETVSRQFSCLKATNTIVSSKGDRDCTILDMERLGALADPQ